MDKTYDNSAQVSTTTRWQPWAIFAILLGCLATLAATLYDIA